MQQVRKDPMYCVLRSQSWWSENGFNLILLTVIYDSNLTLHRRELRGGPDVSLEAAVRRSRHRQHQGQVPGSRRHQRQGRYRSTRHRLHSWPGFYLKSSIDRAKLT